VIKSTNLTHEVHCMSLIGDKFVLREHDTKDNITKTGMQISRKVYGRVTKQGIGKIRTNQERMKLYKTLDLVEYFRMGRLEWLWHVIGTVQTRVAEMF
jgi:hypothetical protein